MERVVVCEEKREDGWVCTADGFDVKGEADAKVCVRVRVCYGCIAGKQSRTDPPRLNPKKIFLNTVLFPHIQELCF